MPENSTNPADALASLGETAEIDDLLSGLMTSATPAPGDGSRPHQAVADDGTGTRSFFADPAWGDGSGRKPAADRRPTTAAKQTAPTTSMQRELFQLPAGEFFGATNWANADAQPMTELLQSKGMLAAAEQPESLGAMAAGDFFAACNWRNVEGGSGMATNRRSPSANRTRGGSECRPLRRRNAARVQLVTSTKEVEAHR